MFVQLQQCPCIYYSSINFSNMSYLNVEVLCDATHKCTISEKYYLSYHNIIVHSIKYIYYN